MAAPAAIACCMQDAASASAPASASLLTPVAASFPPASSAAEAWGQRCSLVILPFFSGGGAVPGVASEVIELRTHLR